MVKQAQALKNELASKYSNYDVMSITIGRDCKFITVHIEATLEQVADFPADAHSEPYRYNFDASVQTYFVSFSVKVA